MLCFNVGNQSFASGHSTCPEEKRVFVSGTRYPTTQISWWLTLRPSVTEICVVQVWEPAAWSCSRLFSSESGQSTTSSDMSMKVRSLASLFYIFHFIISNRVGLWDLSREGHVRKCLLHEAIIKFSAVYLVKAPDHLWTDPWTFWDIVLFFLTRPT